MKYVVSIAIDGRLNMEIEASSMSEAEELALEQFRDKDFNSMDVVEHHTVNVTAENGNFQDCGFA